MRLRVYSVFDEKAGLFLQPFFFLTRGQAVRAFVDAVNDAGHEFGRHSADYTLFECGVFDQSKGVFVECERPVSVGTALEFREPVLKEVKRAEG